MSSIRRKVNISLLILTIALGGWAAWIVWRPLPSAPVEEKTPVAAAMIPDDMTVVRIEEAPDTVGEAEAKEPEQPTQKTTTYRPSPSPPAKTRLHDADIGSFRPDNPFRAEAQKILSGNLEENDSASRHRILTYCEHFRTAYTTRDIDFLRQTFSDNALIIVGHTVTTGGTDAAGAGNAKVTYARRSKREYLERLENIFASGKDIKLEFSGFRIMRHPTMEGIYGVTLRQKYASDTYSDDGYLFLLWDFRDPSMPLIHVRTWQPSLPIINGKEEPIEIADFNFD